MKYFTEMPSICIYFWMKIFLTAVIKDEHTSNDSNQTSLFCNVIAWWQTLPAAKSLKFSFYACSLHRKFALFCTPYFLWYGFEMFSDYVLLLDVTILVWKLKKNNAKYRQIDFTFKLEVGSSSEMIVITKWTNQVLFCLGYVVRIK